MDIERALLKAGVTVAALFAIYQGSQGMQEFARQRSADAPQDAEAKRSKQPELDDYFESIRVKEAERRRSDVTSFAPDETSQDALPKMRDNVHAERN